MMKPTSALVYQRLSAAVVRFRDDEDGNMAFFILFMFVLMIMFGGIAVDVMRFETRRVALQQTLDRAALAAASLTQTRTPQAVVDEYFAKAGIGDSLPNVEFSNPVVSGNSVVDAGLRRVSVSATVTSYNYFMGLFSDLEYLAAPAVTEAAQGVSEIEVMLVLDITGSMGGNAGMADDPTTPTVNEAATTKIQAMINAASDFVTIVKGNDTKNGVSIGVVPYAAQVNIPENLRDQFNVKYKSVWDGVANSGVPNINCVEFPTGDFDETGVSLSEELPMAAVADTASSTTTTNGVNGKYISPQSPSSTSRACTTNNETGSTAWDDTKVNQVLLPTKDQQPVLDKISRLTAQGNTYIAVGMRWATALLDEDARPIYTAIGDPSVQGRPADNDSTKTRKIIVLMTDGEHVTNSHVKDSYKTGLSPIWRTSNNRWAIRFTPTGNARTNGTRPGGTSDNSCSGWVLTNYNNRQFFVPDLKREFAPQKQFGDVNEVGTGTGIQGACDPRSWIALESNGTLRLPKYNNSGAITGYDTATRLDWSEVWRYVRVSWMAQQLYVRSGVSGATNYNTIMNEFRATYLSSTSNMNSLLQANCKAARDEGIEIYGIAFAAPSGGQTQINGCSSSPKENYYFNAVDGNSLLAAFRAIATDISELRLTQ